MSVELPPLPEPLIQYRATFGTITGYTADQMIYHGQLCYAAGVQAALEAAAVVCDAHDKDRAATGQHADAEHCAAAIRAMKSPISGSSV